MCRDFLPDRAMQTETATRTHERTVGVSKLTKDGPESKHVLVYPDQSWARTPFQGVAIRLVVLDGTCNMSYSANRWSKIGVRFCVCVCLTWMPESLPFCGVFSSIPHLVAELGHAATRNLTSHQSASAHENNPLQRAQCSHGWFGSSCRSLSPEQAVSMCYL